MGRQPAARRRAGIDVRRRAPFIPDRPLIDRIEALIPGIELVPREPPPSPPSRRSRPSASRCSAPATCSCSTSRRGGCASTAGAPGGARARAARAAGAPLTQLPLVDVQREPTAGVLGYRPEHDPARRLWFADIAVDPRAAIWPSCGSSSRSQSASIAGMHLSPLVRWDHVQIPLERTAR